MAQTAPIEQSALLVIDIQDAFKLGPRWERRSNPGFESNVDRLIQSWRAAGLPVIFLWKETFGSPPSAVRAATAL